MNNDRTCRSCLEELIPMTSLFQCCKDVNESVQLSEIIKNIAKIEIEPGDGFPDKICELCLDDLKRTYKFITQLQDSDKTLRSIEVLDISLAKSDGFLEEYLDDKYETNDSTDNVKLEADADKNILVSYKAELNDGSMLSFKEEQEDDEDDPPEINLKSSASLDDKNIIFKDENDYAIYNNLLDNENIGHYTCNQCKEKFRSENSLRIHLKTVHDATEEEIHKPYMCKICRKQFKTKSGFKNHKDKFHEFKYKCQVCNKSYPEKMHLKVHMRAHLPNEEKQFICPECGTQFAYEYQLNQHSYKHKDKKPFPCPHCDKGCLTADSLKRHLKIHDLTYEKPKHACQICGKEFPFPSFLAEHMKNHTGERPFLCSLCGKGFRQKGALIYHIRSHQNIRPYKCEFCNSSFVSQGILKVHMRRHTDERPYVCDICGRGFRQSSDCKMHRRIHTGIKLIECSVCKKKMSTTGQLTVHMRMHTGEKPFSCKHCFKRFATRTMVAKHHRTHTGEKPYICSVCGKAFSQSSSLNSHMKIHARAKEKENTVKENADKITML